MLDAYGKSDFLYLKAEANERTNNALQILAKEFNRSILARDSGKHVMLYIPLFFSSDVF